MNPKFIAEQFHGIPLYLDRIRGVAQLTALSKFSAEALAVKSQDGDEDADRITFRDCYPPRAKMTIGEDGVARIAVVGLLSNALPPVYEKVGMATRYTTISAEIAAAVAGGAKGILFAIDSPGGSTIGGAEVVRQIRALGIPKASHTMSCEASAAFHIGASTGQSFATSSAMVGSIGTIIVMYDWSKYFEDYGVEPVVLASGDLKGTGVTGTSLTPAQTEYLSGLVTEAAAKFKADVIADRGPVEEDSMRGQMFFAGEAQKRNLVDAIASESEVRDWLVEQAK